MAVAGVEAKGWGLGNTNTLSSKPQWKIYTKPINFVLEEIKR